MNQRRVVSVVGTRPNLMKVAPIVHELHDRPEGFTHTLIHTGQHYDRAMSQIFLEELRVAAPDYELGVGSGTHGEQTARTITALEPLLVQLDPDLLLVAGDVNSTLAAAIAGAKLRIPVGHVEAGLRSFDRTMPEEVNRVVTDSVADLLFTHSPEARTNLLREGRDDADIHEVGNTMIDTLVRMRPVIAADRSFQRLGLTPGSFLIVTLHRPALVDGPALATAIEELVKLDEQLSVVFPVHPRTRASIDRQRLDTGSLRLLDPLGYVAFLGLVSRAAAVLTDSGGIQEETTYLGVPCFTLRDKTERPVTCELGTNVLLGMAPERIGELPAHLDRPGRATHQVPEGWDGDASKRLVDILEGRADLRGFGASAQPALIPPPAAGLRSSG
jgi:UDP-N-acetylglucosamine 2-epimerase (non-hydrolysing)